MTLRIYVVGPVCVEYGDAAIHERAFAGRQGRLVFAALTIERQRAMPRGELAEILWPGEPPPSWEVALSAVVSNLRSRLAVVAPRGLIAIDNAYGCYQLALPADVWIDYEAAGRAIDEAEGALRAGEPGRAYGWASVAAGIARRPFLPGEEGAWVEARRTELQDIRVRALDCLAEIYSSTRETSLAIRCAQEAVTLEPFRETGYQRLMRVYAAAGERAEAIRTYDRCRKLLADELGVEPAPQTEAVYGEVLDAAPRAAAGSDPSAPPDVGGS